MKERKYQALLERALSCRLTPQEIDEIEQFLAADPPARQAWQEDFALHQALRDLPAFPVSSNFTAQVLQGARRQMAQCAPKERAWRSLVSRQWLPRWSAAVALSILTFLSYEQYRAYHRTRIVESVALLTQAAELPAVQDLKDFQIIQRLPVRATSDAELLAALQQ